MSWTPISNTVPQYEEDGIAASGFYIKFYEAGTTTPTAMATDSTGVTTLDKCELNTEGYPKNGSNAVFIPHIDRRYKIALFRNATDADNNNLNNAVWPVDNIDPVLVDIIGAELEEIPLNSTLRVDTISLLRDAEPTVNLQNIYLNGHTIVGIGGGEFYFDEADTTSADNNGTIIVTTGGKRWKRIADGYLTPEMFGAVGDGVADDTDATNQTIAMGGEIYFANKYITTGLKITQDDTYIRGSGLDSEIILKDASNSNVIENGTASRLFGVKISDITIDGNGANQTATSDCVSLNNTLGWQVFNCHIKDSFGDGINITGVSSPASLSLDTYIHHNRIENCGGFGVDFAFFSGTLEVSFNVIGACGNDGIRILNVDARIIGNHIFAAEDYGIQVAVSGSNTQIVGNHVESCRKHGIFLSGATHCLVDGNLCVKNGRQSTPNTYDGIHLAQRSGLDCSEITITGNTCWAENVIESGLLVQRYGIYLQPGTNNVYCSGNSLGGNQTGGLFSSGVITSFVENNTPIEIPNAAEFYDPIQNTDLTKTAVISVVDSNATHKGVVGTYNLVLGHNNVANSAGFLGTYTLTVTKTTSVGFDITLEQISGTTTGIIATTPVNTATVLTVNVELANFKGIYMKISQNDVNIGNFFTSTLAIT